MSSSSATPNTNSNSTNSTPFNVHVNSAQRKKTPSKKVVLVRKDGTRSFTPAMQDRQARNKEPTYSSDSSSDEGGSAWASSGRNAKKDTWEQAQKRREAAVILDNPELLMMHAQARFDSIPGTRHYFTKLLCGYLPDSEPYTTFTPSTTEKNRKRPTRSKNGSIQRQYVHDANAEAGDDGDVGDDSEDGDEDEEMDEGL